jgi:hypothetical protein
MSKCYWCGKPSTRLCDFPVGGEETLNEQGEKVFNVGVCSKPICEECATKYRGLDVCPKCFVNVITWALENKDRCLDLVKKRRADND